jgi:prophage antirepressor-like protein
MNNELQVFNNDEFGQVRTVNIEGKIYFIAKDIATALGYKDTNSAIKRHCRWVAKHTLPHPQSKTKTIEVNIIPEGDIYRLITNSELPQAEKFESWVFDEVLPTIRKTGGYVANENKFVDTYLPFADEPTKMLFKSTLQVINSQNKLIEEKQKYIEEIKPIVDKYDTFLNTENTYNFEESAKLISTRNQAEGSNIIVNKKTLPEFLRNYGILSKDRRKDRFKNLPNKDYEDYFNVVCVECESIDGLFHYETKIKTNGIDFIYNLLKEEQEKDTVSCY